MKNSQFYQVFICRFYYKSPKFDLILPSNLHEIIIGLILGDLSVEKRFINSNARLQFKQSIINKIYIDHLYLLFQNFCGSPPKVISKFDNRPNKMKEYSAIKFQTLSLPCFNIYRELFYNTDGIKTLPHNLEELLTAKGLAYWIMDDAYKFRNGLYISTESFSFNENQNLTYILKSKFDLNCNVHKHSNGYRIYINSSSIYKLLNQIKPYLLNHFYYKFNLP